MMPLAPMISKVMGTSGLATSAMPLSRSNSTTRPAMMTAMAETRDHFVLHHAYRKMQSTTKGEANSVERAMIVLANPTELPSATSVDGNHSNRPKLTKPQASAASVSAIVGAM